MFTNLKLSVTHLHVICHWSVVCCENSLLRQFRRILHSHHGSSQWFIHNRCGKLQTSHSCMLWHWNWPSVGFPSTFTRLHLCSCSADAINHNYLQKKPPASVFYCMRTSIIILIKSFHDQSWKFYIPDVMLKGFKQLYYKQTYSSSPTRLQTPMVQHVRDSWQFINH